jgi:hypothetical protein
MDKDTIGIIGWLAFFCIVVGLPVCCIFGLPWLARIRRENLEHAREMARIKAGKEEGQNGSELQQLRERCDALEKRCAKLEEQVTEAHALLVDEQRQLDKKLANILPGESQPQSSGERRRDGPVKTVM